MLITVEQLEQIVGCSVDAARRFYVYLNAACAFYKIDTPKRIAAFLAQIGHETGSLRYLEEIWGPTPAQTRYEGRSDLGNTQPGDGYRYRGRGLLQLTGRANYAALTGRLRARLGNEAPDFEATPDALIEPKWASYSAADYWDTRGLNKYADSGAFDEITKRINGGYNGKADRDRRYARALSILGLSSGQQISSSSGTSAEASMNPFVEAALPSILKVVPKLTEVFDSKTPRSEKAAKAVELVVSVAKDAVNANNEQDLVDKLAKDPQAAATVRAAVQDRWFEIVEAGGGGIAGARAADAAAMSRHGPWWQILRSPSFVVAVLLLPLVYMVVGAVVGLYGQPFSEDVRSAISNGVIGLILGGLIGYYYGQVTSRNRVGGQHDV